MPGSRRLGYNNTKLRMPADKLLISRKIPIRALFIPDDYGLPVPRGFVNRLQDDHIPMALYPIRVDLALVLDGRSKCVELRSKFVHDSKSPSNLASLNLPCKASLFVKVESGRHQYPALRALHVDERRHHRAIGRASLHDKCTRELHAKGDALLPFPKPNGIVLPRFSVDLDWIFANQPAARVHTGNFQIHQPT